MAAQVVIAMYRPKPGQDAAVLDLVRRHVPVLRAAGLVSARPVTLLRSLADGTYLEIFEWVSGEAARNAHENPGVSEIWTALEAAATFPALGQLAEAGGRFPHFRPVDGVVS